MTDLKVDWIECLLEKMKKKYLFKMKNRFGQSLKNVFEPYYLNKQKLKMQVNILFGKYKHFLGFVNHQSSFDMIDPVDYSRKKSFV